MQSSSGRLYFNTDDCTMWLKQMAWAYTDAIIQRYYDHKGYQRSWTKREAEIKKNRKPESRPRLKPLLTGTRRRKQQLLDTWRLR